MKHSFYFQYVYAHTNLYSLPLWSAQQGTGMHDVISECFKL